MDRIGEIIDKINEIKKQMFNATQVYNSIIRDGTNMVSKLEDELSDLMDMRESGIE